MDNPIHAKITTVNVWWQDLKMHLPVYLLAGATKALVDCGPPQRTPGALAEALAPFAVQLADISSVLLTHGHLDHVGGLPELKAAGPVQVVIGREDGYFLADHGRAFDQFYAIGDKMLFGQAELEKLRQGFLMGAGPEITPDKLVDDGDALDLGDGVNLRCVHLPGHSMGSMGYYWENEAILICGDAVPGLGSADGSLPIVMDLSAYRETIARLLSLPLRTLVFTHAYRGRRLGPSTVRRGVEIKEYLEDAGLVADRLMESLRKVAAEKSERPFIEIADQVIAGMPADLKFAPMAQQFMAKFSASTIYWGLAQMGRGIPGGNHEFAG